MQDQAWRDGNRILVIFVGETPAEIGAVVGTCRHGDEGLLVVPDGSSNSVPISEQAAINGFAPARLPGFVYARKRYLPQLATLLQDVTWCVPMFSTPPWPEGAIPMPGLVAGLALSATGMVMLPEMDDDEDADEEMDPFDDARYQLHQSVRAVTRLLASSPTEQRDRLGPTCLICDISAMFRKTMRAIGPFLQLELPHEEWEAIEAVSTSINALPNDPACQHLDTLLDTGEVQKVRMSAQRMVQTFGWPATPPPPIGSVEGGGWAWQFE